MAQDEIKAIWQIIKSHLPNHDQFLHWWVLGTVFIVPLLIFNYGFNASIIRQLVLLVLVIIGLLIWVSPTIFKKEPLLWQRTIFSWAGLILLAAILIASLVVPDLQQVWGLRGGLGESNPLGWLAVLGLGLLITQVAGIAVILEGVPRSGTTDRIQNGFYRFGRLRRPRSRMTTESLLISYLSSSTLLALLVLIWWITRHELVMPAWTSFAAASLFFTVNALVAAALSVGEKGWRKLVWLAILLIHLAVIFAYDYDVSWYILAGGMLLFSVAQLVWEKQLAPRSLGEGGVDYRVPFALIVISIGLLFAPVQSLSNKLGFDASNLTGVGANVAYPRFFKYNNVKEILLGHGLGQGAEAFWQKAELVDMSQVRAYPPLGNLFGALLWEGGLVLLLSWLGVLAWVLSAVWRRLHLALPLSLGLIGYLAVLLILPFDWFGLFGLFVFMALLSSTISTRPARGLGARHGERSFIAFGALLLLAFLILLVAGASRMIKSRLDFFDSISVQGPAGRGGTTVNLVKLNKVIANELSVVGYRLGRVDFVVQALTERAVSGAPLKDEEIKPWLEILGKDYDWLKNEPIGAAAAWQLAKSAVSIGQQDKNGATDWLKRAEENFGRAIEKLPRNVILFTEAARFYRFNAPAPQPPPNQPDYLARALELVERALSVDNSYQPAQMEKAELLVLSGKTDEALESVKQVARDNPAAAYSAGRLAFSAKKFDEAINYYKQAISANPNHLQARYELVQAYMALSDFKSAATALDELETIAPQDDTATQTLLKGLRELLKN